MAFDRHKSRSGIAAVNMMVVIVLLGVMIAAAASYQPFYRSVITLGQQAAARHFADQAEVARQGGGVQTGLEGSGTYFSDPGLNTVYHLGTSSSDRTYVWFESAGHRRTVHAKASNLTRGVLDKLHWYQEGVR